MQRIAAQAARHYAQQPVLKQVEYCRDLPPSAALGCPRYPNASLALAAALNRYYSNSKPGSK